MRVSLHGFTLDVEGALIANVTLGLVSRIFSQFHATRAEASESFARSILL